MTSVISTHLISKPKYNVYLFQPQYSATINGKRQYWLPYSAGCIWSYAAQFTDIKNNFRLVDLIFRRENLKSLLDKFELNPPHVCGFSVYAWNEQYCLHIAKEIKKKYPKCLIVFGGPQCDVSIVSKYSFIDSVVLAEGEESFVQILRTITVGSQPLSIYEKTRLDNLEIPSPYTTGVFDRLIQNNPSIVWSAIIESNRGCPYACTFCDWGSLTYSKIKKFNLQRVAEELEWIRTNPVVFITSADANFGIFKERDLEIAKLIRNASDMGNVESVTLTYAKNSYLDIFEIAKVVDGISRGVTVSVQSRSDMTLNAIKRKNLKVNDISEMMKMSEQYGIPAYTELILGLPLETKESWRESITQLLEVGQHYQIDVYFCILLKNSELASVDSRQQYGIKTTKVYDYVTFNELADDEFYKPEEFEIISATNTMSTQELIDSFLYGWMIVNFHTAGYTQQAAKYCRNVLGVPYRKYYDIMFDVLHTNQPVKEQYDKVKTMVTEFVTTGNLLDVNGVFLISASFTKMYELREQLFQLGIECLKKFNATAEVDWLEDFQKLTIFDNQANLNTTLPFDITTWENKTTTYKISPPKIKKTKRKQSLTHTSRNVEFYKNLITKV